MAVEQKATYYGLACKVIDYTQATWAKIELESGQIWVPKETVIYV
jgi:RNase P/RNase MRP subunit p29